MFTVKAKNSFWDIMLAIYLQYFFPPHIYILLGLSVYWFWKMGGKFFIEQKAYAKVAIFAVDTLLFQYLLFFLIAILLSIVMRIAGRFRIAMLETEYTFD